MKNPNSTNFDPEPMKIVGKDGQVKTVVIGKDVTELKHTHVVDDEHLTKCLICEKELSKEEQLDAQSRIRRPGESTEG